MFKKTLLVTSLAFVTFAPLTIVANTLQSSATAQDNSVLNEAAITAKVKALYAKSSLVKGKDISVTTNNKQVVLTGQVATDLQYERAIYLAQSVKGVDDVDADNLTVKASKSPLNDTLITAKVKGNFLREKLFGKKAIEYWPVKVETKDAVVYLTGRVDSDAARKNLINLTQSIKGVKSVNSSITVN